ncbi:50S ribosome-binding GTPase, partial [Clostridioides difficile]|nr:50S ribosome-binding GTPase [Clostridioides difficile]
YFMQDFDFISETIKKFQSDLENMDKVNILVVGKTGVGKSTLINNIFREELAETGIGRPVTQHLKKISKEGLPINLYDTKGLELEEDVQETIKKEILDEIENCNRNSLERNDKSELMHVCWYCINTSVARCEETDIKWINELSEKIPVIVVLTQGFPRKKARELKSSIDDLNLNCKNVIPVLAEQLVEEEDEIVIKSYGLDKLVEVTYQVIPKEVKKAFVNVQKVDIKKKVEESRKWVLGYVGGSGAIGFSPIPFSDAPLLATAQVAMISHITVIFGLQVDKALLTAIVSSIGGVTSATLLGKTLVSNILKFIPGAGTIAGGAISGSVAALTTTALGMAYISVLEYILNENMKGNEVNNTEIAEKMKDAYKDQLGMLSKK